MEQLLMSVALALLGACMGSFAGAIVWRLRARQLVEDTAAGERVDKKEYKKLLPLTAVTATSDRSRCLQCGHQLAWYDLLPLMSWISTGGACRYCHKKIGWFEPAIEIGVAALFVVSYLLWPYTLQTPLELTHFATWLLAGVALTVLFAYDLKWFLLPNYVMFPLIALAAIVAGFKIGNSSDPLLLLVDIGLSVSILSGLYLVLWYVSKGQWIGFGDVKLGLALGLLLADWRLAFIALFMANLIGCLIVIPAMILGKMTRKTRVPFGPLLILGFLVAFFFGESIFNWYFTTFL